MRAIADMKVTSDPLIVDLFLSAELQLLADLLPAPAALPTRGWGRKSMFYTLGSIRLIPEAGNSVASGIINEGNPIPSGTINRIAKCRGLKPLYSFPAISLCPTASGEWK